MYTITTGVDIRKALRILQLTNGKILTWRLVRIFLANHRRGWVLRKFKRRQSISFALE